MKQTAKLEPGMIRAFHMEDSVLCGIILKGEEAGYKILTVGGVEKSVVTELVGSIEMPELPSVTVKTLQKYYTVFDKHEEAEAEIVKHEKAISRAKEVRCGAMVERGQLADILREEHKKWGALWK